MDGIITDKPRYPEFAFTHKRQASFETWPSYLPIKPDTLVESGFYYSGEGDLVKCFFCCAVFSEWENDNIPNIEHIKLNPICPFMNLTFDRQYIDNVSKLNSTQQQETRYKDPMTHATVLSCIQNGFDEKLVKLAIDRFYEIYQHMEFDSTSFTEMLFNLEDEISMCVKEDTSSQISTTSETVKSEPESKSFTCSICYEDVSILIIFVPCGHMNCCVMCCVSVDKCPVCRKLIKGMIRPKFE